MRGLYKDYSRSAEEHMYNVAGMLFRAYASKVKFMYTSAPGHIVHCREFTYGLYTDIVSYIHME